MDLFFACLINGLSLGSIYALLVTGLNLMMLIGGIFQFAYPHVVVMSMYILWVVLGATGNVPAAMAAAVGAGVGLSLATEPIFRPLIRKGGMIPSLIVAIALGMILADIQSRELNAGVPIGFPASITGGEALARVGVATITIGQVATIAGSFGALAFFMFLLYRTKIGRSFRAIGGNPELARVMGIPVTRTNIISYAICGIFGGISAIFLSMYLGWASCTLGNSLALLVFATVLVAGMGHLKGGLICGIILGLVYSFSMGYLPGQWATAIVFSVVLGTVIVKPMGLFGLRI